MAKVDYFLKLDTIPGESQDPAHRGEIDLLSFSWGESQVGSGGGGGGAGKVQKETFSVVKQTDVASPALFLACAQGRRVRDAVITLRNGDFEFVQIKLEDVLITSYNINGSEGGTPAPLEEVRFDFARMELAYKQENGQIVRGGFDFQTSSGF